MNKWTTVLYHRRNLRWRGFEDTTDCRSRSRESNEEYNIEQTAIVSRDVCPFMVCLAPASLTVLARRLLNCIRVTNTRHAQEKPTAAGRQ